MRRRTFIATSGMVAIPGCQGIISEPEPVRLGNVEVTNRHEESHNLNVSVETNGEEVFQEEFELPGRDNDYFTESIHDEMPLEATEFTFKIDSDVQDMVSYTYDSPHEKECYNLIFAITRRETIDVLEGMKGHCPE